MSRKKLSRRQFETSAGIEAFDAVLDVHDGGPLRLAVDLNNMHLLNEVIGAVI